MSNRDVKKDKMGDDPPYLAVGTDVSAKYKGAFCEAKVRKVVRVVRCKVQLKNGGMSFVMDDQIKGNLRIGGNVEVKLPDKKEFIEASIVSIKDLSQYTVVFDDGDITTLRRTALCLKSGRHFADGETLDQLPLTHPEHFSTPVIGGASRRGRRRLQGNDDSSDDEDSTTGTAGSRGERQREADIGKVVCVEISEKKKVKDNWFPGLIVAPNAQDAVRIHVDEDYLVRSFKDGRYFTVPKKEATEFTREIGLKVENPSLKLAVEKALVFLDKDELPPHWDRDLLFGLLDSDLDEEEEQLDSDSSDDEPREEKDHFVAQLYKFMDDRGTPINKGPIIQSRDVDLYRLFRVVHKLGGCNRVTNQNQWKLVTHKMGFGTGAATVNSVKHAYKKFLHSFEDFYRKLGCTMVNHPRGNRRSNKSNRSLIRDKDRATPVQKDSDRIKSEPGVVSESSSTSSQCTEVKVEVKREDMDEMIAKKEKSKEFEAKRERHVKEEAQRRERTRDKTGKDAPKDSGKEKDTKEEAVAPLAKKKVEETQTKIKVEERPKQIGILAKFSYRKDKTAHRSDERDKDRLNRVKKSVPGPPGMMERQKRAIKETVKALAKSLGFGGKPNVAAAAAGPSSRKLSTSTSGEDDEKKRKDDTNVIAEKKRLSSTSTPPPGPPVRKNSLSGGEEKSCGGGRSNSRNKNRKPDDEEPGAVSSNPGETSDGLTLDIVSPHKWISVGDKLRVYYGPNHKSKVTYEAKVVSARQEDGKEREYLVHYTGWNTRYDEWIRRNRIADNLTWNTGKEPSALSPGASGNSGGSGGSSKSRTTPRRSSNRITRITRSNTDDSESDKESDDSESETDTSSLSQMRSMRSRRILSEDEKKPAIPPACPLPKTRANKREEDKEEEEEKKKTPNQEAERKSLRLSQRKKQERESDSSSGDEMEDTKPKVLEIIEPLDDVYEFKEPEPFNFKQKKTISPPNAGQKGKKNIGLFEDYDNIEEEHDDINAAIQRVMDSCSETRMDLDLMDLDSSNSSSDSNSSDSNNMCEIMKKRLQSEINTYEGPKSKLKGKGDSAPSTPPSMRTRRCSESKSGKSEGKSPAVKTKLEEQTEAVKTENNLDVDAQSKGKRISESDAGKTKKTEDVTSKSKKSVELDTSVSSPKARKSDTDINSGKLKKADIDPKSKKLEDASVASPKSKRLELERSSSPKKKVVSTSEADISVIKVKKTELEVSKNKKADSNTSPNQSTDSSCTPTTITATNTSKVKKAEATQPQAPAAKGSRKLDTPEVNVKTRLKTDTRSGSPGSKTRSKTELIKTDADSNVKSTGPVRTDPLPYKSEIEDKVLTESKLIELTTKEKVKITPVDGKTKVGPPSISMSKKLVLTEPPSISKKPMLTEPPSISKKPVLTEPPSKIPPSIEVKLSPPSKASTIELSQPSQSPRLLTSADPSSCMLKNISPVIEIKKVPLLASNVKPKVLPFPGTACNRSLDFSIQTELQSPLPKLIKIDAEPKPCDIPVLQRIESVLPKTPLKREAIDPTKIDLIKVSPNMPQLEKIDFSEKLDLEVTPVKEESSREETKFPSFEFDDVAETPEKIFLPATETEEVEKKPEKKIEFKMKPKAPSPLGFAKKKLIRTRVGDIEPPVPVLSKYAPDLPPVQSKEKEANVLKAKDTPVPEVSKVKDTFTPLNKVKEAFTPLNKVKDAFTPLNKVKDTFPPLNKVKEVTSFSPSTVPSKVKDSPPLGLNRNKELTETPKSKDTIAAPLTNVKALSPVPMKEEIPSLPVKNEEDSVIVPSKTQDVPVIVPVKSKDPLVKDIPSVVKSKESAAVVTVKSKDSEPTDSSKSLSSEQDVIACASSKPLEAVELEATATLISVDDIVKKSEESKDTPSGAVVVVKVQKDEKESKKDEVKPSTPLEVQAVTAEPSDSKSTSEELAKTPTKSKKPDVEKTKRSEEKVESKELSSVFEFDETLEDELADMDSAFLTSSKRKLIDSPGEFSNKLAKSLLESPSGEFMSNKLAKMNELEKLKQKLFMDCSGESEEGEKSGCDVEGKEAETKELTTDETLEEEEGDNPLLCKETIPGSPTPYQDDLNMIMELPATNSTTSSSGSSVSPSVNAVLDNTPPTTPESSLSPPRNECEGSSSNTGVYTKMLLGEAGNESPKKMSSTPMKRRSSTAERNLKKRLKQSPRNTGAGSDSDDLSLSESFSVFSPSTSDMSKSKYSYFVELDPELDQAQRIAVVQQKLQDLRKEYMMYKQELVTIDRRRKKIRRRERENKKNSPSPVVTLT